MSLRSNTRAIVGLVAAYAVALQATFLAIGGSVTGITDLGHGLGVTSLCLSSRPGPEHPVPGGHEHDCPAACAACCCGAPAVPVSVVAAAYENVRADLTSDTVAIVPTWRFTADGAHRSRAPPLG
jgi:hypothetical protein